jgi:hemerythrin-like domain-containing protein
MARSPVESDRVIERLAGAHARHEAVCDALGEFCRSPDLWPDPSRAAALARFFRHDLPLHVADEEEDLLPCLLNRGIIAADGREMAIVHREHDRDRRLAHRFVGELAGLAEGRSATLPVTLVAAGAAFAHSYRCHIATEERVLLPLARHLVAADEAVLRRRMAVRRA